MAASLAVMAAAMAADRKRKALFCASTHGSNLPAWLIAEQKPCADRVMYVQQRELLPDGRKESPDEKNFEISQFFKPAPREGDKG